MYLIEVNRDIEEAKNKLNNAKNKEEYNLYKSILVDLRSQKRQILNNMFK